MSISMTSKAGEKLARGVLIQAEQKVHISREKRMTKETL